MPDTLSRLQQTIAARRRADPAVSYVARLSHAGRQKIAQKVGEEAVETIIAAVSGSRIDVISETADLMFHLMVLLADCEVSIADIFVELERRDGVSGLDEKAARAV